jgi:hypothetical protein
LALGTYDAFTKNEMTTPFNIRSSIPQFYRLRMPCESSILFTMTIFLATASAGKAQALTIVSPPGHDDREGNRSFFPNANNFPFPQRPHLPPDAKYHGRFQELHPASFFSALGPGPLEITSLAWRPDRSVNQPTSDEWDLSMRLSTTAVGDLSLTFAENIGPGGLVEVFSGVVELATDGVPRSNRLPHEFDYMFEFDTPFLYDPQQGDLLIDVMFEEPVPAPWIWADADGSRGQYVEVTQLASVATSKAAGLFVTQFTIIPEPSGLAIAGTSAFAALAAFRRRRPKN